MITAVFAGLANLELVGTGRDLFHRIDGKAESDRIDGRFLLMVELNASSKNEVCRRQHHMSCQIDLEVGGKMLFTLPTMIVYPEKNIGT